MGYGILAKNPGAECVDDFSIWTQKKNTFMSIANDDCKNKQSCVHFLAVFFTLGFFFLKEFCYC